MASWQRTMCNPRNRGLARWLLQMLRVKNHVMVVILQRTNERCNGWGWAISQSAAGQEGQSDNDTVHSAEWWVDITNRNRVFHSYLPHYEIDVERNLMDIIPFRHHEELMWDSQDSSLVLISGYKERTTSFAGTSREEIKDTSMQLTPWRSDGVFDSLPPCVGVRINNRDRGEGRGGIKRPWGEQIKWHIIITNHNQLVGVLGGWLVGRVSTGETIK